MILFSIEGSNHLDHLQVLDLELASLVEDGGEDDVLAVTVHHRAGIAICQNQ